jgi:hypothetical protein
METIDPSELAEYFRIADELLGRQTDDIPSRGSSILRCTHCNSARLVTSYAQGDYVCYDCALVQQVSVFQNAPQCHRPGSNYKRIHHWHERISQMQLNESCIPAAQFCQIETAIRDAGHKTLDKSTIRSVLRSLNLQKYIEKWLQIIWRITHEQPPLLTARQIARLDVLFVAMQVPFVHYKPDKRKNFLNYNYVFNRLLQMMQLDDLCKYFPLIKSKSKLMMLETVWASTCAYHQWNHVPLRPIDTWTVVVPPPLDQEIQKKLLVRRAQLPLGSQVVPFGY